jgi:hypothetical protein
MVSGGSGTPLAVPGVRGYFDKVEIGVRGDAECIFDAHYAYLFTARSD